MAGVGSVVRTAGLHNVRTRCTTYPQTGRGIATSVAPVATVAGRRGEARLLHVAKEEAKAHGVHHTPPRLARFLASQLAVAVPRTIGRPLTILDPACGDGELLLAAFQSLPPTTRLVGIDRRPDSIRDAQKRLNDAGVPLENLELWSGDFLDWIASEIEAEEQLGSGELAADRPRLLDRFDGIIANPPYVRTQVMGAKKSRHLARLFDTNDRTDLYHAFIVAITRALSHNGCMSILCSNRFLTTRSGAAVRGILSQDHRILKIIDLGDTKFFKAAVLPAIVVSQRSSDGSNSFPLVSVYERVDGSDRTEVPVVVAAADIMEAVAEDRPGLVKHDGKNFVVSCGQVRDLRESTRPWTLTRGDWLARVRAGAKFELQDLGRVRVGIKTTADAVFIRDDWQDLPASVRPEDELLLPLVTHRVARRWALADPEHRILYPYRREAAGRTPVDLKEWPRARAYLQTHRERLESRSYVTAAGRAWWEIWVPQKPAGWAPPKLVFPDISESPRFAFDSSGSLVNGDCYWFAAHPAFATDELLYLVLAVANSQVAQRFYDECCGNRLYAGRRRYMTQYVGKIPIPDPCTNASRALIERTRELLRATASELSVTVDDEREIEGLVRAAFGLEEFLGQPDLQLRVAD